MSRRYDITQEEVRVAWKAVRRAGGGCGHDRQTIKGVEADLDNQLYKIWNRMTSGSYIPKPVLYVDIPKAKGGVRRLGVPTVSDRIAQTVIKNRLEPIMEKHFHEDSYAYRPNKSALDAVTMCRARCFKHKWLVEVDIKQFFDDLDHDITMQILQKYTDDLSVLLYARKFLKAPGITQEGETVARERGTPQGGVISPLLANMFLHEVFDKWMQESHHIKPFERYADDIVVHCVSEKQAIFMKDQIEDRLKQYQLTMHPEKSRIVYTGTSNDHDHRGHGLSRKFTFLGYDFKPRYIMGRTVYSPGMSTGALKAIRSKIREQWNLRHRIGESIEKIAKEVNPVIRGWFQYYGAHRPTELNKLQYLLNWHLARFIKKKHKTARGWGSAWAHLMNLKKKDPKLFVHWYNIRPAG